METIQCFTIYSEHITKGLLSSKPYKTKLKVELEFENRKRKEKRSEKNVGAGQWTKAHQRSPA
jgi:hypothetical protein